MELELRDYLRILSKRRWLVVAALVACLGAAGLFTARATPVYEAEAKLFVGQQQISQAEVAQGQTVTQLSFQLLKSYAAIIRTRPIAERAVEREGLPVTPTDLVDDLRADPILDTQIIRVRYRAANPSDAQRTVNAIADAFVDEVGKIEGATTAEDEPAVKVTNVEPALRPERPVSPQPVRNMALAFVLGMMLGVGVAFLAEYLDTTVKDSVDAEQTAGVPVLAVIPKIDTHGAEVYLERDPQAIGAEGFRKLRTAIQFLGVDRPVQTVLVTSPYAQEGKTTTALNLAAAYAQAGLSTVLVEADLRRPSLHKIFPAESGKGLTTVLIGRVPLDQAVVSTTVRNLSVVLAGALPPNPVELLGSDHMRDTVSELRRRFDVVILDAPPILPVADASALATRVDGTVVVARTGHTHRDRLAEATEQVRKSGGKLLGVVLNFLRVDSSAYGYAYYGYRSERPAFERTAEEPSPRP